MALQRCLAAFISLVFLILPLQAADTIVPARAPDLPLPRAKPEDVGFSSERLARIGAILLQDIEHGQIPGAVLAIARHGKLVFLHAYGWRDKATHSPMTTDTLFNIASMTKPMTTVGALMLYERGLLLMNDPLTKYFPQFSDQRVAARDDKDNITTNSVPVTNKIVIQDLLRHTSGIVYGNRGTSPVHKMYPESSVTAASEMTGKAFLDKLAALPLLHQPGAVWDYGFGLDIVGLLIESVSQQSLGSYLEANLFAPLGMHDTGFFIKPEKANRYAKPLPIDPVSRQKQTLLPNLTEKLLFDCGGDCAYSTATDYLRFALMLLKGGDSGKAHILGRKTADYMLANQLGPQVVNLIGQADPTRANYGFGLGLAVRTTPGIAPMLGSIGSFGWPGSSGTDWWVDPKEDLVVVYLSAAPGAIRWHYRQKINALVYQALDQ
ncbi:serine hydrolase domain-containing protein [Beijerinckia indica]|uniref:Beta-lactamase n=1 Tax=Beijerinckia indica subsp. indica (strain ATCC 9039 / DSM 1715 / NCIMB 8712) TaxID=395963 RepID=B2IJ89_BEII9|nr:serine hydrolase domain-containing protein [Beijerinckia indica]ACB94856.1 beta-lactamase [Beijerinckia indica subsp. indica ATCC 9039]